jgi:hypothetical protein
MFMLLTRRDYDRLVQRYPSWMASVFPKIIGRWYLAGPNYDDRFFKRISLLLSRS